jgi:hypothetical protein
VGWPSRHGRIARHTVQHAPIAIRGSMMTIDNGLAMVAVETMCGGVCGLGIGKSVSEI